MAQSLRALVLREDPSSVPNIPVTWLTTIITPAPGDHWHSLSCAQTHIQTQTTTHNLKITKVSPKIKESNPKEEQEQGTVV